MPLTRRGVALAEAVVAALLTAVLVAGALGAFSLLQRALARQLDRTGRARTLRSAAQLLATEWRDLAAPAGDVHALGPGSVTYRGFRGSGTGCGSPPGALLLEGRSLRLLRLPAPGRDSLLVLAGPDAWTAVAVTGPPVAATCPDGSGALAVPVDPAPLAGGLPTAPFPFRLFEVMELRAYQSGGAWWIGLRSVSAGDVIQPAFGPVAANGLTVTGLDSAGAVTGAPALVHALQVVLRLAGGDSLVRIVPVGWSRP